MSLYLGIDLGTQGVKVLVFDADARRVVARAGRALPAPASPRPGAAEQNPTDWWDGFVAATQEALAADCEKWDIPPLSDAEMIQLRIRVIALENMVLGLLSKASANQLAAIEEIAEFISPRADAKPHPLTLHAATQMEHFVERARRLREQPTAD